jgi:hypothetical protein
MHAPTCPVKMAGTLQRPARSRYVFNGAIFGVWFYTVKQRDEPAECSRHAGGEPR